MNDLRELLAKNKAWAKAIKAFEEASRKDRAWERAVGALAVLRPVLPRRQAEETLSLRTVGPFVALLRPLDLAPDGP